MESEPICDNLLRMGEFDDTFGLFAFTTDDNKEGGQGPFPVNWGTARLISSASANHSLNSTGSPFGLGLGSNSKKNRNNRFGTPTSLAAATTASDSPTDPFSPAYLLKHCRPQIPDRTQVVQELEVQNVIQKDEEKKNLEAEVEQKRTCDGNVNAGDNVTQVNEQLDNSTVELELKSNENADEANILSESDSLLDIDNLSSFSIPDEEGIDELIKQAKIKTNADIQKRINDTYTCGNTDDDKTSTPEHEKVAETETAMPVKKDTVDPDLAERRRRNSVSTKLQRLSLLISSPIPSPKSPGSAANYIPTPIAATPVSVRRSQSFGFSSQTPRATIGTMTSPYKSENSLVSSTVDLIQHTNTNMRLVSPSTALNRYLGTPASTKPKPAQQLSNGDNDTAIYGKRLSFQSSSSDDSPSKRNKKVNSKVAPPMQLKFNSSISKRPIRDSIKPDNSTTTTRARETTTPKSIKTAPKYIPPVAQSSPLRKSVGEGVKERTTPSRIVTGKEAGISTMRNATPTSVRRYLVGPTTLKGTTNPEKAPKENGGKESSSSESRTSSILPSGMIRPVMGAQGQLQPPKYTSNKITADSSLKLPLPITTKRERTTNATDSKENRAKPKLMKSALPRPGGWKKT